MSGGNQRRGCPLCGWHDGDGARIRRCTHGTGSDAGHTVEGAMADTVEVGRMSFGGRGP